jgi:hypothetical protein
VAVDYTTLFTRLGKIVKAVNDNLTLHGTTLPARLMRSSTSTRAGGTWSTPAERLRRLPG